MTITTSRTGSDLANATAGTVRWTVVQPGLWVGNRGGEFAGMVERIASEGYIASSGQARKLGAYNSLGEAKARVARE